jgi:hypothetical protein
MSDESSTKNTTQCRHELAVSYVRARCDTQQEEEQLVSGQQQRIDAYAKQHDLTIVSTFFDRGCGAGTGPALADMYKFLAQHPEVRCVIVDTPERLTRNSSDWQHIHALGLQLHFAHGAQRISPSFAPIGYRNAVLASGKRGLVPESKEAEFIKRCFERFSKGPTK